MRKSTKALLFLFLCSTLIGSGRVMAQRRSTQSPDIIDQLKAQYGIKSDTDASGIVTAIKANLRGTPTGQGIVVTTLNKGEAFELIKDQAPWYLIQTEKYVGWIHGNAISLNGTPQADNLPDIPESVGTRQPQTTTKALTTEASPFQTEYVGGDTTIIHVKNDTDRLLTLKFGGVTYQVNAGSEQTVEVGGGRYEFSASVPRAYPVSGVKQFETGTKFSWTFFIVHHP